MHKLCVVVAAFGISAFAIPAFAEDLPVSLSKECKHESHGCNYWEIRITSRVDSTTIRKVVANRGNCKIELHVLELNTRITRSVELPQPLNFGEALLVYYRCDPIEVEVTTDQDSFIFTFDE